MGFTFVLFGRNARCIYTPLPVICGPAPHTRSVRRQGKAVPHALRVFVRLVLTLAIAAAATSAAPQSAAPPLGRYATYRTSPLGNASYVFDFVLLTASSPDKPGHYELQMGSVPEAERERWRGTYLYLPEARRVQWLSGPFQRSALYQLGEKNTVAGETVQKNGRWTIFLNNNTRGTSVAK